MTTMIVWLLVATSSSMYNYGSQSTIATFADAAACQALAEQLKNGNTRHVCVKAQIVVPK